MWAIGNLIGNVMNAGVADIVPVRLGKFRSGKDDAEDDKKEQNLILLVELQNGTGQFFEIGRSGFIELNDNEYDIDKSLQIPYHFTEVQRLKFVAYLVAGEDDAEPQEAGVAITSLGLVETERIDDYRSITMSIGAEKLEKKELFGKTDPYLEIFRKEDDGSWTAIHRTEHLKDTQSPQWNEFVMPYNLLCGNDADADIRFACYDYNRNGSELIGEAFISPAQLLKMNSSQSYALLNSKKKHKKKGLGRLIVRKCKVRKEPSFISYLLGGCNLHLTTGIDFTASNGSPQENTSLHYTGSMNPNGYVVSMRAVGSVLQEYTRDKQIAAYGYGAKIPPDNAVSHDFALHMGADNPMCMGIEELIPIYCKALSAVKLWGPTNLSPIINKVITSAENCEMAYHVLLLLTDGVITDLEDTKDAIVRASKLPVSVIIVGIGNADFAAMEFLNKGPKSVKSPNGEAACRDIVKFVTFRKANLTSIDALGKSLLDHIPSQVVEYFTSNEIDPSGSSTPALQQKNGAAAGMLKKLKGKAPERPKESALSEDKATEDPEALETDNNGEISAL